MSYRFWTQEEVTILEEMYSRKDIFASDIASRLGRSVKQVYLKAMAMGLKRPWETKSRAGKIGTQSEAAKAHRFKKGQVPPNKGKRMPEEIYKKVEKTMFRKGNVPATHRPVGTETLRSDGYIWVKVEEPNKWRLKQRLLWEQHNGPIPPGYNVQFKDHNPKNCRIENLYIISRSEQMRNENSLIASYPKPLADLIRLKGAVNRQIHKQQKNGKER